MSVAADYPEPPILETHGLLVKGQAYHAVLTSRQIILTGESDQTQRSIGLKEVWRIGQDEDPSGDPVITISIPSAGGIVHNIILHFPLRRFPNAFRLRDLWASEINRLLQLSMPGARPVISSTVRPEPLFCSRCGNLLAVASVFCSRCGARVPAAMTSSHPRRAQPPVQLQPPPQDTVRESVNPLPLQPPAPPQCSRQGYPNGALRQRDGKKKRLFFSVSQKSKNAIIIGSCLFLIIIIAAVILIGNPLGLSKNSSNSSIVKVNFPGIASVPLPTILPEAVSTNSGENPKSVPNSEAEGQPEAIDTPSSRVVASGDLTAVLADYPTLFNNGDGTGLYAILSENMKEQNPPDALNSALASSRSSGYSIQNIEVINQVIEGESAVIDTEITWKSGNSMLTSMPKLFLVYENNRWKLDNLVFHP